MYKGGCLWCGNPTNDLPYCYLCENRKRVAAEQQVQTRLMQEKHSSDDFNAACVDMGISIGCFIRRLFGG